MSTTTVTSKKSYNCNKCNQSIIFDNATRSKTGKAIPLNIDGSKHQCNDSSTPREAKLLSCNYCKNLIRFDKTIVSKNGKQIPLNQDGSKHSCPNSPYNKSRQQ